MCVTETGPYFWLIFLITFLLMPLIMFLFALIMCLVLPGVGLYEATKGGSRIKKFNSKPIRIALTILYIFFLIFAYLLIFAIAFSLVMLFMVLTIIPGYFY